MENECKLISEIKEGMELAKQLNQNLVSANGYEQLLLQRILSSFDNALLILQWRNKKILESSSTSSPENIKPEDFDKSGTTEEGSKKRKGSSVWTDNVTVRSENGLESPTEDGHSWRKYGQKDILRAKYPRSYYRCTYRNIQSCWATKQVQRSDEDPTLFEITYKGKHTCTMRNPIQSSPSSSPRTPPKQITKQQNNNSNETLMNLRKNLKVDTNNDNGTNQSHFSFSSTSFDPISNDYSFSTFFDDNLLGGYSPKFLLPANSDSNLGGGYFSANSCEKNGFGAVIDLAEIISTNTSVSNSPVVGADLSIDSVGLDDFEFDNSDFFR